jgi:hypothetical protein
LTWWYAFGAARYHPHSMVRALRSSFEHYGVDPQRNNTVPGQFSEWFDGESLANRGMRLSPWEPPRFLWAAVEGVCGLVLTPGAPRVNPLMPSDWNWIALRDVPYHGEQFSYFVIRESESNTRVYTTRAIECDWRTDVYSADVSDNVWVYNKDAIHVALRRDGALVLLFGNTGMETAQVDVQISDETLVPERAEVRVYNSERRSWERRGREAAGRLSSLAFSIERGGFRLFEMRST